MTQDAVIVSYARTGLTRSFRGGFNATHGAVLGAAVINARWRVRVLRVTRSRT